MKRFLLIFLAICLVSLSACTTRDKIEPDLNVGNPTEESSPSSDSAWVPKDPFASSEDESSAEEESNTQQFLVPEGYTLARVGMKLEELGYVESVEEFIEITEDEYFDDFEFIFNREDNPNRAYKLEGYLFPDTYEIYKDETVKSIVSKMLNHTEKKIDEVLLSDIEKSGYTLDETIILASIIEKEAFGVEEMANISSVLHNRLEANMKLQCDVTISYVEGAIVPFVENGRETYAEHYNTYKAAALPAGAICNPSIDAIKAAVYPADTDYLYFLTDKNKKYYYTADYEEHKANEIIAGIR